MKLKPTLFSLTLLCASAAVAKPINVTVVVDFTHHNPKELLSKGLYPTLLEMEILQRANLKVIRVCNTIDTLYQADFNGDALSTYQKLQGLLKPCTAKGSAITQGIERASNQLETFQQDAVLVVLTDGGLSDDPQKTRFIQVVRRLKNPLLKKILLVGLQSSNDLREQFTQPFNRLQLPVMSCSLTDCPENLSSAFMALTKEGY